MFFMAERWTREIKRVKTFGNWMQYEVARSVHEKSKLGQRL